MRISEFLNNDKKYLAHKDGVSAPLETIEGHSSLVLDYAKKIIKAQNLEPIIKKLGERFFEPDSDNFRLWEKMFFDAIYLHDIGKANTDFQAKKMGNKEFSYQNKTTKHSLCSSVIYFGKYYDELQILEEENIIKFIPFLLINSFVISKHHGYLSNFIKLFDDIPANYKNFTNLLKDITVDFSFLENSDDINELVGEIERILSEKEQNETFKTIDYYIYAKLLYSLLVSSDFYATSEYMSGFKTEKSENFGVITDVSKFYKPFSETETYKNIQKYSQKRKSKDFSDINEARSEMFLEAEENLIGNLDKNLFYLEAPTGSGKTNTAINLSLQIVKNCPEINKIFYVFPFNTLVEQTKNTLLKSFSDARIGEEIGVINSITPIYEEDEKTDKIIDENGNNISVDYTKILMGRQFLHYPIVVTTHIKMFDWLFGIGREAHFPLCQLANSVVILDEIQSYKNNIWKEIAVFLKKFAEILNIKIIIMSATLPKIDKLIPNKNNIDENIFLDLIKDRNKYFSCPYFKNRVIPNFDLIDKFKNLDEAEKINILQEKIFEQYRLGHDVLVEFINKKRSLEFFKSFKERYTDINSKSVFLLNGDDNLYTRNKIISEIKNPERNYNVILFSTQVIEAGVDIDLDTGFKDISILDAEEQFMGRINRSCKKENCVVYFFKLDDMSKIYKNDKRNEATLEDDSVRKYLTNKEFGLFYETILDKLDKESRRNTDRNFDQFRQNMMQTLDFTGIKDRLKLLKDDGTYTVFLNREIETDDGIICGKDIWEKYKKLLENFEISYAEKQIELSKINKELSYFCYSARKISRNYNEIIGDVYYFDDGEQFFTAEGKFDRTKFEGKHEKVEYEFL